jgi:cytochrome c oxidase assembly factor CtaG
VIPSLPGVLLDARARPDGAWLPALSPHLSMLLGTAILGALYFWGIGPARRRWNLGPPARQVQVASFVTALVVLVVSLNGPIHDLSDYYLFLIHMLQHLLLTLLFPPLLIFGTPGWLIRPLVRPAWVRKVGRFLSHPVVAGGLFTFVVAAWHTTPLYDLMMRNHDIHIATHLMFIVTAVIMWWPVMSPIEEVPPLPLGARMLYIFLVSIPMQVVAASHTRKAAAGSAAAGAVDPTSATRRSTSASAARPGPSARIFMLDILWGWSELTAQNATLKRTST